MDTVINHIIANKPDLKETTVLAYAKVLQTLKNKMHNKKTDITLEMFQNVDAVNEVIKTANAAQKKNYAIALKAVYPALYADICRDAVIENQVVYASDEHREKSKEKNSMNAAEIETTRARLEKQFNDAEKLLKKNISFLDQMLNEMQKWVLFSLYFTDGLPPRRALDYLQLKFRNYDEATDNYLDLKKKMFNFNNYKTSGVYGKQMLFVPDKLLKTIKKYIKYIPNTTDTLLFRNTFTPMGSVCELTAKLNEILGAGKSINAIRHFYLTSKYEDAVKKYDELSQEMNEMGSSVGSVKSYVIV